MYRLPVRLNLISSLYTSWWQGPSPFRVSSDPLPPVVPQLSTSSSYSELLSLIPYCHSTPRLPRSVTSGPPGPPDPPSPTSQPEVGISLPFGKRKDFSPTCWSDLKNFLVRPTVHMSHNLRLLRCTRYHLRSTLLLHEPRRHLYTRVPPLGPPSDPDPLPRSPVKPVHRKLFGYRKGLPPQVIQISGSNIPISSFFLGFPSPVSPL